MKRRRTKAEIELILDRLEETYPDAKAELNYTTPYELLVATILSAQCTDVRVNKTTEILFQRYNTPEAMVTLTPDDLGVVIKECGLYKTKAKNIIATSHRLLLVYDSSVPQTMDDLLTLPGVGRKTANVVLSNAFGVPGIAVDTHVFRVSNRIGLADAPDVETTEKMLQRMIPKNRWSKSHHTIIFHGRRCCKARKPLCESCPISEWCYYYHASR